MFPGYEISIGLLSIFVYVLFTTPYSENRTFHLQTKHLVSILKTKSIDPTKSDYYYERGNHAFDLCPLLHSMIHRDDKYRMENSVPVHDFGTEDLSILNQHYMEKIYHPVNFPYTHRNHVYIRFTNQTANYLYRVVCKNFYAELPSSFPAYGLCIFMTMAILYRFLWRA